MAANDHIKSMKNVTILEHPLLKHKISILRNKATGTNEFRAIVEEIAMLMGYEALRDLPTEDVEIETPIETCTAPMISGKKMAIIPILRAGLGMVSGMLALVPSAKVGHIGMYRDEETHEPHEYYCKLPENVGERIVVVVDPMLATGSSLVLTYNALCEKGGTPAHTHVAAVVASEQGLDYAMKNMPRQTTTIWTAVVDEELTSRSYIVPGIGDAGDLAYGEKI